MIIGGATAGTAAAATTVAEGRRRGAEALD